MRKFTPFLFFLFICSCLCGQNISALSTPYSVGLAKTDITFYQKGAAMLGYSMAFNTSEGVKMNLQARSFVLEDAQNNKIALVVCELAFITQELKTEVITILNQKFENQSFTDENVLITAQHTHCGPAGFSHHASYNMAVPGFIPHVFDSLASHIARGILQADANKIPCQIQLNKGIFPDDWEVGFNRALAAYNQNKGILPVSNAEKNKAINREMCLLNFLTTDNQPLGSINWFGVHATNISNDNHLIHPDNKGYAAAYLEKDLQAQNPNYVGAFAQGSAGDVSPKYIFNKNHKAQRGYWEGKFPDDLQSATYNGNLQYQKAKELVFQPSTSQTLTKGGISSFLRYYDFSNVKIDTCFSHTKEVKFTSPSCMGMSMLGGSLIDGPAAPLAVVNLGKKIARFIRKKELARAKKRNDAWAEEIRRKYQAQGKKDIIMENGARKILGTTNIKHLFIPGFADETLKTFKLQHRQNALGEKPWTPQILPLQFLQIGNVVLVAFPFEITTTAARRLQQSIAENYKTEGISEVILCPYSNAYSGYITTYDEYQVQLYEGGHTVFGEYSLAALQMLFQDLLKAKSSPQNLLDKPLQPVTFTQEELNKRLFYFRKSYLRKQKKAKV